MLNAGFWILDEEMGMRPRSATTATGPLSNLRNAARVDAIDKLMAYTNLSES
jgi:hypothetical protein